MPRKEFSKDVAERVLVQCRRHCCVCDKFCGTKVELHHIGGNDDNSEDNALLVCFDCHAEIKNYNRDHPKGRKYRSSELRRLRAATVRKYSEYRELSALPSNPSDYGRGFHDGMNLAEKRIFSQDVWRFIGRHGDFAIEILTEFDKRDQSYITDEYLFDDNVVTDVGISQSEGNKLAWSGGYSVGFWYLDINRELLCLTKKGRFFREIVQGTPELSRKYEALKQFWASYDSEGDYTKPGALPPNFGMAGWLGWLQAETFSPIRIQGHQDLFVILSVSSSEVVLKSIDTGEEILLDSRSIRNLELEQESGVLVIDADRIIQE